MFVCPVPKISQVMMKWQRQTSHLGRFTLLQNGRRATQLGRFTLWHNGGRAKCSFVRCRKYHKSWWDGAAKLHISVDLLCCTTAAELHNSVDLLWGTTAAELHNSVDLLCGTTAAGLHNSVDSLCGTTAAELNNPVSLMRAPGVAHIFQRQWRAILKYEGLMIRSKTLLKLLNALEDNSTNTERVKVRQNVSNRLKVRQMCVDDKCNLEKTSLINCTGHPIITERPKQIRGCVLVPRTQSISVEIPSCRLYYMQHYVNVKNISYKFTSLNFAK